MRSYQLTALADQDILDIWTHIAQDDPGIATDFVIRIERALQMLSENPRAGRDRSADARQAGIRTFPVGNYVVIYQAESSLEGIFVLRVVHAARDVAKFFI